jgi:hypothetical protein
MFENATRREEVHENSAVLIEIDYVHQWYELYGIWSGQAKVQLLNYLTWKCFNLLRRQTYHPFPTTTSAATNLKQHASSTGRPSSQRYLRDATYG